MQIILCVMMRIDQGKNTCKKFIEEKEVQKAWKATTVVEINLCWFLKDFEASEFSSKQCWGYNPEGGRNISSSYKSATCKISE